MIGIDEVGRGSWAGPLLVCAVRLKKPITGLRDSKKLSPKKRIELSELIEKSASIGFGWVSAQKIDEIGLAKSLRLGVELALEELPPKIDEVVIIDGIINYVGSKLNSKAIIKADDKIACVSAASIVAKVNRDRHMRLLADIYPIYGFEHHVGYGTALHKKAILQHGMCNEHRRSFKIPGRGL